MQPHCQHRNIHLIDDVHIRALVVQFTLTDDAFIHCLSQGIPGTQILPHAGEPDNLNLRLMLHHRIVKGDLLQRIILIEQVLIICKVHQFVRLVHHVAQLIGKNAAIPECPMRNVLLCHIRSRLFLKCLDCSHMICAFRDDVAILFAGVGRLDAHQHKVCIAFIRLL